MNKSIQILKKKLPYLAFFIGSIRYFFKLYFLFARLRELEAYWKKIKPKKKYKSKGIVIVNIVRNYLPIQLFLEIIFSLKMKHRGYDVKILYDDFVLLHHDTLHIDDVQNGSYYKLRIYLSLLIINSLPNIKKLFFPYSKLKINLEYTEILNELISNNYLYKNIDFWQFIEASLVRFYRSAPDINLLKKENKFNYFLDVFTQNSLRSYLLAEKAILMFKPKLLITSHGIYSTWGPFAYKFINSKIKVITYEPSGYVKGASDFSVNGIAANKTDKAFYDFFIKKSNTLAIKKNIRNHARKLMSFRLKGLLSDPERIKKIFSNSDPDFMEKVKSSKKKFVALFPNVMWDNATTFKDMNTIFTSPVDWIVETVSYFLSQTEKILIIRSHPAELFSNVRYGTYEILLDKFGHEVFSHPSIQFINSNQPIISYDLFPFLDCAIVYNGTIGVELLYSNIPLIIASRSAYSNKGFTYNITDKAMYFDSIKNSEKIRQYQLSKKELLYLFIIEYFELHGVPLKALSKNDFFHINSKGNINKILNDKNLNHIIDVFEGKKNFFQEWKDINLIV